MLRVGPTDFKRWINHNGLNSSAEGAKSNFTTLKHVITAFEPCDEVCREGLGLGLGLGLRVRVPDSETHWPYTNRRPRALEPSPS